MPRERRRLAAGLGALLLSACATLDESECRGADWFEIGSRDGAAGYAHSRLEEHRKACSEFGLNSDDAAWRQGYAAGLEDYCTLDNGYRLGRRGGYYGQVCPAGVESAFLSAYELGRETYDIEREIEEVSRRIEAIESRLVRDRELDDGLRAELRRQLSDLYLRHAWLRRSRDRLEAEWRRRY